METSHLTCSECHGGGSVRTPKPTVALTSAEVAYESRQCSACSGTGVGRRGSVQELQQYSGERLEAPGDIFEMAKSVATRTVLPRAKIVQTKFVPVAYGFLGRKTRTEQRTEETTADYWILLAKGARTNRTGSACERGGCEEEDTEREIQFRLGADGSLMIMERERDCVLYSGTFRYEEMTWSDWNPRQVKDLSQFMIDFDFEGSATADGDGWRDITSVVGDMKSYILRGQTPSLRRLFPKGVGLYNALATMI